MDLDRRKINFRSVHIRRNTSIEGKKHVTENALHNIYIYIYKRNIGRGKTLTFGYLLV